MLLFPSLRPLGKNGRGDMLGKFPRRALFLPRLQVWGRAYIEGTPRKSVCYRWSSL